MHERACTTGHKTGHMTLDAPHGTRACECIAIYSTQVHASASASTAHKCIRIRSRPMLIEMVLQTVSAWCGAASSGKCLVCRTITRTIYCHPCQANPTTLPLPSPKDRFSFRTFLPPACSLAVCVAVVAIQSVLQLQVDTLEQRRNHAMTHPKRPHRKKSATNVCLHTCTVTLAKAMLTTAHRTLKTYTDKSGHDIHMGVADKDMRVGIDMRLAIGMRVAIGMHVGVDMRLVRAWIPSSSPPLPLNSPSSTCPPNSEWYLTASCLTLLSLSQHLSGGVSFACT